MLIDRIEYLIKSTSIICGMTLTPCAPLGAVLFSAAAVASPWHRQLLVIRLSAGFLVLSGVGNLLR